MVNPDQNGTAAWHLLLLPNIIFHPTCAPEIMRRSANRSRWYRWQARSCGGVEG